MEAIVADHAGEFPDIISVEGSFFSTFVKHRKETIFEIINVIKNHDYLIFISKTSDSMTSLFFQSNST
jgi:hypothetical protein